MGWSVSRWLFDMCCLIMRVALCFLFTFGNLVMGDVLTIGVVGDIQLPRPHMKYIDGCANRLTCDVTGADILRGTQLF
jgi:hypothetical protein